jgi:hypothetical protein
MGLVGFRRKFGKQVRKGFLNERIQIQFTYNKATGKTKR